MGSSQLYPHVLVSFVTCSSYTVSSTSYKRSNGQSLERSSFVPGPSCSRRKRRARRHACPVRPLPARSGACPRRRLSTTDAAIVVLKATNLNIYYFFSFSGRPITFSGCQCGRQTGQVNGQQGDRPPHVSRRCPPRVKSRFGIPGLVPGLDIPAISCLLRRSLLAVSRGWW